MQVLTSIREARVPREFVCPKSCPHCNINRVQGTRSFQKQSATCRVPSGDLAGQSSELPQRLEPLLVQIELGGVCVMPDIDIELLEAYETLRRDLAYAVPAFNMLFLPDNIIGSERAAVRTVVQM